MSGQSEGGIAQGITGWDYSSAVTVVIQYSTTGSQSKYIDKLFMEYVVVLDYIPTLLLPRLILGAEYRVGHVEP